MDRWIAYGGIMVRPAAVQILNSRLRNFGRQRMERLDHITAAWCGLCFWVSDFSRQGSLWVRCSLRSWLGSGASPSVRV